MLFRRYGRHPNYHALHHLGHRYHHNSAPHNADRLYQPLGNAVATNGHFGIHLHRARPSSGTCTGPGTCPRSGPGTCSCPGTEGLVRELFGG
ncbi:hypothetical protein QMK32_18875 [Rhodococcus sp. H29-C3]|nr:hypothetical protein [Rhodococcus sp. H29-C3]MDJ0362303.1 hypothetical protein [Rhodococcus sp. H29-C3]